MKFLAGLRVWVKGQRVKLLKSSPGSEVLQTVASTFTSLSYASISGRRQGVWSGRPVAKGTLGANHVSPAPESRWPRSAFVTLKAA